ncbi:hypothetical protein E3N88_43929 [Mikania micrantha]|uniref:Uncharacterized protein n=1 Tax=Mikania micrantha TaxID=192012 RepID=A0A5N6LDN1_9ASTR|nr:hypothetical protein E3N88_43929 [Mikania micrantha]
MSAVSHDYNVRANSLLLVLPSAIGCVHPESSLLDLELHTDTPFCFGLDQVSNVRSFDLMGRQVAKDYKEKVLFISDAASRSNCGGYKRRKTAASILVHRWNWRVNSNFMSMQIQGMHVFLITELI